MNKVITLLSIVLLSSTVFADFDPTEAAVITLKKDTPLFHWLAKGKPVLRTTVGIYALKATGIIDSNLNYNEARASISNETQQEEAFWNSHSVGDTECSIKKYYEHSENKRQVRSLPKGTKLVVNLHGEGFLAWPQTEELFVVDCRIKVNETWGPVAVTDICDLGPASDYLAIGRGQKIVDHCKSK